MFDHQASFQLTDCYKIKRWTAIKKINYIKLCIRHESVTEWDDKPILCPAGGASTGKQSTPWPWGFFQSTFPFLTCTAICGLKAWLLKSALHSPLGRSKLQRLFIHDLEESVCLFSDLVFVQDAWSQLPALQRFAALQRSWIEEVEQ